ncbi:MAG: hypothetical protein ACKO1T_07280 [Sediminibacterium sp.]
MRIFAEKVNKKDTMQLKILAVILLTVISYSGFSQDLSRYTNRDINDSASWIVKADSLTCRLPYFNVNKDMKDVNEEFDRFLKNDWLESVAVVNQQDAVKEFGPAGRNGVFIVVLKKGTYTHLAKKIKVACKPNN